MHLDTNTIIIGAGPAGLATAVCLDRAGVDNIILERHAVVGSAWHNHYERLHLHTLKRYSYLPHRPFPKGVPKYPSRQDVVDYLTDYAQHFNLAPRFGQTVQSTVRDEASDTWLTTVRPTAGDGATTTLRSRHVVCATGYSGTRKQPHWPNQDDFDGEVLHSAFYKNGVPWRGKRVMVVGIGNSGGEIALDLFEHGATPCISVRGPVHVLPRDMFGLIPAQATGLQLSRLPPKLADRLALPLLRAVVGDLTRYGLRRPAMGPAEQVVTRGKIPLIDIGTIDLIKQGHLTVVPEVRRFTNSGVEFVDGTRRDLDAVIMATGFVPALERFLGDRAAELTDDRGYPRHHGTESTAPGLWFLGFRNPLTGQLNDIRAEATRVAGEVSRKPRRTG